MTIIHTARQLHPDSFPTQNADNTSRPQASTFVVIGSRETQEQANSQLYVSVCGFGAKSWSRSRSRSEIQENRIYIKNTTYVETG